MADKLCTRTVCEMKKLLLIATLPLFVTGCLSDSGADGNTDTTPPAIVTDVVPPSSDAAPETAPDSSEPVAGSLFGDRTYLYSDAQLAELTIRRDDLKGTWVETPAEPESPEESGDPLTECTEIAFPDYAANADAYDGLSAEGSTFSTKDDLVNVSSMATAFYTEELAQRALGQFTENEEFRSCLLDSLKSVMTTSAGAEGFLTYNHAVDKVDGLVPYEYGTVLSFTMLLSDGEVELPIEMALLLIGKGTVLTVNYVFGYGDYDTSFVVPMVAKVVSRVETLTGPTASELR